MPRNATPPTVCRRWMGKVLVRPKTCPISTKGAISRSTWVDSALNPQKVWRTSALLENSFRS